MGMSDKIFGNYTTQNKKRITKIVREIDSQSMRDRYASMSDKELSSMTQKFKDRLKNGETIDDVMVEAIAVCREATKRTLGMYHYPVQIEAAVAMQDNAIAEMKTGEGKTLVQILSAYLNALKGESVHVITSNVYLAGRDNEQNSKVYEFLGLSCGYVGPKSEMNRSEKREQYSKDIVYATASTIVFDYLDDNKIYDVNDRVITRGFGHAIIDEIDSILLDDATTPLITSGKLPDSEKGSNGDDLVKLYEWATEFVDKLSCRIFDQYEHDKSTPFSEDCVLFKDQALIHMSNKLYNKIPGADAKDPQGQFEYMRRCDAITNCLLAKHYYTLDEQYTIQPKKMTVKEKAGRAKNPNLPVKYEVALIGANSGRISQGRRLMNGIHEALEAKEAKRARDNNLGYVVDIKKPSVTTGTCTYPDFMSMYKNGICGMTGTSNSQDFLDIYGISTYEVPSRKTNIRLDKQDEVYATQAEKYKAIVEEVLRCQETLQPVLIGVTSVEESELVSRMLAKEGIRHSVLNAKQDANEAGIIANAGQLGRVTIATNMAGRGTDIKLGEGVNEVGGLYVIGSTINKNERIDNQLKGRAARQGNPGTTKYFGSLEDPLVKIRGGHKLYSLTKKLVGDGKPLGDKAREFLRECQRNQEGLDKKSRINSEKYGSVLTTQKNEVYRYRNTILEGKSIVPIISSSISKYISETLSEGGLEDLSSKLGHLVDVEKYRQISDPKVIETSIISDLNNRLNTVSKNSGYEKDVRTRMLKVVDSYWFSQLSYLQETKQNAMFASYAGKDPFEEYKLDSFSMFKDMVSCIRNEIITYGLQPQMQFGEYTINNIPSETLNIEKGVVL